MSELRPATVVVRSTAPITATIDDETVMLDPRHSAYYGLDPTGSAIWELLDEPVSIDELCIQLTGRFDVDRATCERDVIALLVDLLEAGLVERAAG